MKLTTEQRRSIVEAYLSGGFPSARLAAQEFNVGKCYLKNLRFRMKLPKMEKKAHVSIRWEDPRWARARERGTISI